MQAAFINIGLSFIEGIALIASPCILPILPIILAGSLTGSKKRPLGIIIGFILFFTLFTFFTRTLVQYSNIDVNFIRHLSYVILIALGIIMLSSYLTDKFNIVTQKLLNTGANLSYVNNREGRLASGILFGGLIAIIWTPCAGPILAAVLIQSVLQQTNYLSFLTLLAFSIGAAVPMLFIIFFGRNIMAKLSFFKTHARIVRKSMGLIIIISVVFVMNLEYGFVKIESQTLTTASSNRLINGLVIPYKAPEIDGIEKWYNSPPLHISDLKGKILLIDFWTYSCINCLRTLPYIKGWYDKYHNKGLVIIGIHSPEFAFEKDVDNVNNAVNHLGIKYPVALDNKYLTWSNFQNSYWPAHYLIDKNGMVVYTHFGEGEYNVTENNIRYLLGLDKDAEKDGNPEAEPSYVLSPETYLGYSRAANFASPEPVTADNSANYTVSTSLSRNQWALTGKWTISSEKIIADERHASLTMHFYARHVYVVMGSNTGKNIQVKVTLDGKTSVMTVLNHKLYEVGTLSKTGDGIISLSAMSPGLELYTFTFGAD